MERHGIDRQPLRKSTKRSRLRVAGVDGCRGGWLAALVRLSAATGRWEDLQLVLLPRFGDMLRMAAQPYRVAVDIPVGLLDVPVRGGRECDRLARRLLQGRRASVFTPPTRRALAATTYREAQRRNAAGLSCQAFNILPRIREMNRFVTPARQKSVYEAHPELAFLRLAGRPMRHNKKTPAGQAERRRALSRYYGLTDKALRALAARFPRTQATVDDVLDALALAVTAAHLARGTARCLPPSPPRDRRGRRMEIIY